MGRWMMRLFKSLHLCHSEPATYYLEKNNTAAKGEESIDERNETLLVVLCDDRFFGPHE